MEMNSNNKVEMVYHLMLFNNFLIIKHKIMLISKELVLSNVSLLM